MEPISTQSSYSRGIAREMKETFFLLSPFIQKHTEMVCPSCEEVCCAGRHGRYDSDDFLFLNALGVSVGKGEPERDERSSCRFLSERGCLLERWMRPYRCTFFFCDQLLMSIESDSAKLYRAFIQYFQHLVSLRKRLVDME